MYYAGGLPVDSLNFIPEQLSTASRMKRHLEWLTQPDQTLKDRSRFWTWYMRGLHGNYIATYFLIEMQVDDEQFNYRRHGYSV